MCLHCRPNVSHAFRECAYDVLSAGLIKLAGLHEILGYLDGMIAFGDGTVRSATAVPLGDATLLTLKLEDETSIEYILTHGSEEGSASLTLLSER